MPCPKCEWNFHGMKGEKGTKTACNTKNLTENPQLMTFGVTHHYFFTTVPRDLNLNITTLDNTTLQQTFFDL